MVDVMMSEPAFQALNKELERLEDLLEKQKQVAIYWNKEYNLIIKENIELKKGQGFEIRRLNQEIVELKEGLHNLGVSL